MDHHGTTSVRPVYGSRMRDNRRTGLPYMTSGWRSKVYSPPPGSLIPANTKALCMPQHSYCPFHSTLIIICFCRTVNAGVLLYLHKQGA